MKAYNPKDRFLFESIRITRRALVRVQVGSWLDPATEARATSNEAIERGDQQGQGRLILKRPTSLASGANHAQVECDNLSVVLNRYSLVSTVQTR